MEIIEFDGFWTINDVRLRKDYIFVFGDNDKQYGKGGQAIIRDEPNTHGIPTKKCPNNRYSSFYTDDEYDENIVKIDHAINKLLHRLKNEKFRGIILPKAGLGTGLAKLPQKAPKTYRFLVSKLDVLKTTML
jgi:hypothetical protein